MQPDIYNIVLRFMKHNFIIKFCIVKLGETKINALLQVRFHRKS